MPFILVLSSSVAFFACAAKSLPAHEAKPGASTPRSVEIDEYRGEKLGAIADFNDNSIKGVQRIDRDAYRLAVGGLVSKPLSLAYEELLALPRAERVVTLNCVEGWSVRVYWEGFRLSELLDRAEVAGSATTLILYAADGYSTTIPLADARAKDMLVAYRMNGLELPPERGFPLQLVAEDKWGYKWIKWIERIDLSVESDFRGYWEERGYNQKGDYDGPRFEEGPEKIDAARN